MLPNVTFLEAYNCDGSQAPRPEWADRARKQVYRTDYVLSHFVHYSTVTTGYLPTYKDLGKKYWTPYYEEQYERVTDELEEATMIHAKSLDFGQTVNWQGRCVVNSKRKRLGCYIGFPWPKNQQMEELPEAKYDPTSKMEYNCFVNEKVDQNWIPRLEQALEKRKPKIIDEQFQ